MFERKEVEKIPIGEEFYIKALVPQRGFTSGMIHKVKEHDSLAAIEVKMPNGDTFLFSYWQYGILWVAYPNKYCAELEDLL